MRTIKLGKFILDESNTFHGRINGLGIGSTNVLSEPATSADGKNYYWLIADPLGNPYEIGAAFPKEKEGLHYYSVQLESPLLDLPINAALFPDRSEAQSFNLIWNRPDSAYAPETGPQSRRFIGAGATP